MATIALYAGKMNQVPGMIGNVKKEIIGFQSELLNLKKNTLKVNQGICDLSSVISSIQAASQIQEEKICSLDNLTQNLEHFVEEAVRIDDEIAGMVRRNQDDFYEQYNYLKPECEMNGWEKFCDGCAKAGEWCRENWESIAEIVKILLAAVCIIALCVLTFGVSVVCITLVVGAVVGVVSQLVGDLISWAITGDWNGNILAYVGAALGGAIGGCALMLTGNPIIASALEAAVSTSFAENLENIIGETKKSIKEIRYHVLSNVTLATLFSVALKPITNYLSKNLSKSIPWLRRVAGSGNYDASYRMVLTKLAKDQIKNYSYKTVRNGVVSGLTGGMLANILNGIINAFKEIFEEPEYSQ